MGADSGAPVPAVLQVEGEAAVVYHAAAATGHAGERVVLRFGRCLVAQFRYPDDEALGGPPLHRHGLSHYDIFEVRNSSWLERLRRQNLVCFPDVTWWPGPSPAAEPLRSIGRGTGPEPLRHFVVTFHDDTFECLAATIGGTFTRQPLDAILSDLVPATAGPGSGC